VESDRLGLKVEINNRGFTRRKMLSMVSSIYDPLGLVAPFTLPVKLLLQDLCRRNVSWDEVLSDEDEQQWRKWMDILPELENVSIPRCYKPDSFGKIQHCELHTFADGSNTGYGAVSYLRMVNEEGQVHCSIIMGKSRVAPLKAMTIPRLELTAAGTIIKDDNGES
jgi:hypothetical protein